MPHWQGANALQSTGCCGSYIQPSKATTTTVTSFGRHLREGLRAGRSISIGGRSELGSVSFTISLKVSIRQDLGPPGSQSLRVRSRTPCCHAICNCNWREPYTLGVMRWRSRAFQSARLLTMPKAARPPSHSKRLVPVQSALPSHSQRHRPPLQNSTPQEPLDAN